MWYPYDKWGNRGVMARAEKFDKKKIYIHMYKLNYFPRPISSFSRF